MLALVLATAVIATPTPTTGAGEDFAAERAICARHVEVHRFPTPQGATSVPYDNADIAAFCESAKQREASTRASAKAARDAADLATLKGLAPGK